MALKEPGAGELNRRITLRKRTDAPGADMGLESSFSEQKQRWARIVPVGTVIYNEGLQTDNKVTHRVTLRWLSGIDSAWEVVHGATVYRVRRAGSMNGELRFLLLDVEELGAEQSPGDLYG